MARVRMAISFDLPPGATREDALAYAVDAVQTMKGCLRPDGWDGGEGEGDPMFYLDSDSVSGTIATVRQNKRRLIRVGD